MKGMLSGNAWVKNLDTVLSTLESGGKQIVEAFEELSVFFSDYLAKDLLPYSSNKTYESENQIKVYRWLDARYSRFVSFINNSEFTLTPKILELLEQVYNSDKSKAISDGIAKLFVKKDELFIGSELLADPNIQDQIYMLLINTIKENHYIAEKVITADFPNPTPSRHFTELFFTYIKSGISNKDKQTLMINFSNILNRVDEKLELYNFLEQQLSCGPVSASLSIPYLVEVAVKNGVDVSRFYELSFSAITPESLSVKSRAKFFNTLDSVLTPKTLPTQTQTAFAVKLSRMLPLVGIEVQLDILSLLHHLVLAHEAIAALLKPMDGEPSRVDGTMAECAPQTLWEVIALQDSPVTLIAESARTLGHRRVAEDYGSFGLRALVENCHARPSEETRGRGNLLAALDQGLWK